MGEAKRRGTFEERKAQALDAGRIKKPPAKIRKARRDPFYEPPDITAVSIFSLMAASASRRGGKGDG